jgi:hypothetical protein
MAVGDPESGRNRDHSDRDAQVRAAFIDEQPTYADRYFDYLLSRQEALTAGARRSALLILVFGGLHYLLLRTAITQASVGGFQLNDLSLLRSILPAVIAFIYYELAGGIALQIELQEVSASLMRRSHSGVWRERLLPHILPPNPSMFGSELEPLKAPLLVKIAKVFQTLTFGVMLWAPIVYVGWAVWLEARKFGPPGWEEIVAICAALVFLAYGIILLFAAVQISRTSSVVPPE